MRAPSFWHPATRLATGLLAACALALVQPALSQSGSSLLPTTTTFNLTGTDPYSMSCSVIGAAPNGVSGPTGTVTLTDTTTNTTLATAQLGTPVKQAGFGALPPSLPGPFQAVGDFNNDGHTDIVAGGAVYLGNGDGTFQAGKVIAGFGGLGSLIPGNQVLVGDFNGDGKPDLAWLDTGELVVFLGNGDGTFQSSRGYSILPIIYAYSYTLQVIDVDGDGYSDLLIGAQLDKEGDYGWYVARNNHQNGFNVTFTLPGSYYGAFSAAGWDLLGNGKTDLVAAWYYGTSNIQVYISNGDGTFQAPVGYTNPFGSQSAASFPSAAGYFNNNGALDLAFFSFYGPGQSQSAIGFWLGNGDGTFQIGYNYELSLPAPLGQNSYLTAGSFLKRGEQDLFFSPDGSSGSVWIYGGNGDATFTAPVNYLLSIPLQAPLISPGLPAFATADFNGDGLEDLVGMQNSNPNAPTYVLINGTVASATGSESSVSVQAGTTAVHSLQCSYSGDTDYAPSLSSTAQVSFTTAATPVFSLKVGAYFSAQSVSISDATAGASIYYTTDGSTPTANSTLYTGPIPITSTVTLKAIGAGLSLLPSQVSEAIYQLPDPPTFSLPAGFFPGTQSVSLQDTMANATIYYTTDGTTPSTGSTVFTAPISVSGKTTLEAVAKAGQLLSPVASISYNTPLASTTISLASSSASTTLTPSGVTPPITLTASVGGSNLTGTVRFAATGNAIGTVPVANGSALLHPAFTAAGSYSITASYSGDSANASSTSNPVGLTVNPAVSATVLSASAPVVAMNQQVTLTAAISGVSPSGTVTFTDGATTLGSAKVTGATAALATSFANAGHHVITASYSGDANNSSSVSNMVTVVVNQIATTVSLSASAKSVVAGQQFTLTATVTGLAATGSITFTAGSTTLGKTDLIKGTTKLQTSFSQIGNYSVTATYSGDTNNAPGISNTVAMTVGVATSGTSLSASANSVAAGQQFSLTATVTGSSPTGSVTFAAGSTTLGKASLTNGTAILKTSFATAGNYSITASYSGDTNNAASTSSPVALTVTAPVSPSFAVSANPTTQTIAAGQTAAFTITVTPTGGYSASTSFACSTLPSQATCSFSPSTVTPSGGPASTKLTISTTAASASAAPGDAPWRPAGALVLAGLLGLFLRPRRAVRWLRALSCLAFLAAALLAVSACGGGGSMTGGGGSNSGTPAGTYSVSVNVTGSAAASQNLNIKLIVQ